MLNLNIEYKHKCLLNLNVLSKCKPKCYLNITLNVDFECLGNMQMWPRPLAPVQAWRKVWVSVTDDAFICEKI